MHATQNYIDDLIVHSEDMKSHAQHLRRVFGALRDDTWYLSFKKSQIARTRVHLLGHWLEAGKVFPDATYVSKLKDLISPGNSKDKVNSLQKFLGTLGYYRNFIPQFGTLAHPLTLLLRKKTVWKWGPEQEEARRRLCETLQEVATIGLRTFSSGRETRISTDASAKGLGASMEQLYDDVWVPVSFYSKALTPAQTALINY